jgi:protein O-GlcNAc transferase
MAQLSIPQTLDLASHHHQAGRLREAEQLYRQILSRHPGHPDAIHYLGVIAHQVGRNDIAEEWIRRAIALKPDYPEAQGNLGNVLQAIGRLDQAIAAYRQAVVLAPNYPDAHNNLGNALKDVGRLDEAIAAYRQAIALKPHFAEAYTNLGIALENQGELESAIAAHRQAIALNPALPEAHNNLGNALSDYGQPDEAIAAHRQAVALRPSYSSAHSNLVFSLHYHPSSNAETVAQELRCWNRQHAQPLQKLAQPHSNDRDPQRRLRIGYVSPDFRRHPVGHFLLPLLAHHDKSRVEVLAYAHVRAPDSVTQRLQSLADHWRNILGIPDHQAADLIRKDRIDLLVDLAMHASNNRLLIFAYKPAPVQATYLAYCSSTGLETIDYRLSDPYLDPPEEASFYTERTIRLPSTYWCYEPSVPHLPLNPLPALANGYVTFGCLNNFRKLSQPTLATWAKLLGDVPNSRLLLSAHEGAHRQRALEQFQQLGIPSSRIRFSGRVPHLDYFRLYHQVDIALDPFPFAGGMTTCDALWMGVPTVSLAGTLAVGRAGLSILSNIGAPELVARSPRQYLQIAAELANEMDRLSHLRSRLRKQMEQSPLMDAPRFARDVETAFRSMWETWCAS